MSDNASQCGALTRQYEAAMMTAKSHAANVTIVTALVAARPDADEPATDSAFGTLAAQYADMLGLGLVTAPVTMSRPARPHLITGHTMTRRPVLA